MDLTATLDAETSVERLLPWIEDLGRYPQWLEIVARAEATDTVGDDRPAWLVELRGSIGPLARSKRLRMVRTVHDAGRVVFERVELDDRVHAPWILTAEVSVESSTVHLRMHLHYGGRLWGRPLEVLLRQEIERSRQRLLALTAG